MSSYAGLSSPSTAPCASVARPSALSTLAAPRAPRRVSLASGLAVLAVALSGWATAGFAQNLPVPGDCGGFGNRACPIGAPAAPIGDPVGAAGMAAPGAAGFGGAAAPAGPAAGPAGYGGLGAPAGTPPPENGFSWQQRTADGQMQSCRRGLDGVTVRCEEPTAAPLAAPR